MISANRQPGGASSRVQFDKLNRKFFAVKTNSGTARAQSKPKDWQRQTAFS
jgi:hypothetical protein